MQKIAIPIHQEKLSVSFGHCSYFKMVEISKQKIIIKNIEAPNYKSISEIPKWLSQQGITDIITYKINKEIMCLFNKFKINLFVGIPIDTAEHIIEKYLNEELISDHTIIAEIINSN